jgi:hypothetical protein
MSDAPMRLTLSVPERSGTDEVLVGVVALVNDGPGPVSVNARLNLAESDLAVLVTGPGGPKQAGWPWPVDSGLREVTLGPGQALETGVLLLSTATSQPLFPTSGSYTLVASYAVSPTRTLTAPPVQVLRTPPAADSAAAAASLADRDVIQSIAAAGAMGGARPRLEELTAAGGVTAVLASLALGSDEALDSATVDPVTASAAASAVLLEGDERRDRVAAGVAGDARAAAILAGDPHPVTGPPTG